MVDYWANPVAHHLLPKSCLGGKHMFAELCDTQATVANKERSHWVEKRVKRCKKPMTSDDADIRELNRDKVLRLAQLWIGRES